MGSITIQVRDHISPSSTVLEAAEAVGTFAAAALQRGESVVVTLEGVLGVPSSFFNVVLAKVGEALPNGLPDGRFEIRASTDIQRSVFARSLEAYKRSRAAS